MNLLSRRRLAYRETWKASYDCWMTVHTGFVDIEGPFLSGGVFYRGVVADGVYLPVLDKGASKSLGWGLGLPLHSNLQG